MYTVGEYGLSTAATRPQGPAVDYGQLFESFRDARNAFERLLEKGEGRPAYDLVRDPDYLELHKSGVMIGVIGGEAAIKGAIEALAALHETRQEAARGELQRLWCGMGTWTQ